MRGKTSERELAHRAGDGLEVVLLWRPGDDRLRVVVDDARAGETFELEAPRERALDVFHHPYAHAARGGELQPRRPAGAVPEVFGLRTPWPPA